MAKLRAVALLLAFVILPLSVVHHVEAVDYLFWDGPNCSGVVDNLCTSIANGSCCNSPAPYQSVQVREADKCQLTTVFSDGCATNVTSKNGSICFNSDSEIFVGSSWNSICINGIPIADIPTPAASPIPAEAPGPAPISGARRLLSYETSEESIPARDCKLHVEVDRSVIYYRDSPANGIWSLHTEGTDTAEKLKELSTVPEGEKVFWMFSHGATYDFNGEGEIQSIVQV